MSESNGVGVLVKLPSKGKPYEGQIPNGELTVFSMKTPEEKMFGGISKRMDFENVIDALIRKCSNLPKDFRPEKLYIGDRTYLMMMIRAASYGALYNVKIQCESCKAQWDQSIDIMKDLEILDVPDDHTDPFEIELPCGDLITLRLFRGEDERSIITYLDRHNKKLNLKTIGDPGYIYRLALHVVGMKSSVDPSRNFDADLCTIPGSLFANAQAYIENLSANDSSAIREEIDLRTPGIKLQLDITCPKCSHDFELALPMSADFFRATRTTTGPRSKAGTIPRAAG